MKALKLIIQLIIVLALLWSVTIINAAERNIYDSHSVKISPNAIGIPVGHFLLIRKEGNYCAMRFTHNWTGKTKYEMHAEYESYYQNGKTNKFINKNIKYLKEEVYYTNPSFYVFGHPYRIGSKLDICCGPFELWWSAGPNLVFIYYNRHDERQGNYYGIELAPTPWTDIKEVNVLDPRVKWYKYDEKRQRVNIPIDKLWESTEKKYEK